MKKFWFICLVGFSTLPSLAATISALTASLTDVQTAYNLAKDGDTILIPGGAATWNGTLNITKAVSIIGAGTNQTIISRSGRAIVFSPSADKPFRLSGIRFNINGWFGGNYPIEIEGSSTGSFGLTAVRIDHCWFERAQYTITLTGSRVSGVVDHNTFHNCDNGVQMNGDASVWTRDLTDNGRGIGTAGTTNALVIEDNLFLADIDLIGGSSSPNECIMSGHGVRFVVRNNIFDGRSVPNDAFLPYENHGPGGVYTGASSDLRGPPLFEIYNNTVYAKNCYRCFNLRGGQMLIYGNRMTVEKPAGVGFELTADFVLRGEFASWAAEDQIANAFFWDNTYNGAPINDIALFDPIKLAPFIKKDRDYFMHPPDANSGKITWSERVGGTKEVFTPGVAQKFYPYSALVYPHPLVSAQGGGTPSTNSLISVSPGSWNFGTVALGASSDANFTVRNIGGGILNGAVTVNPPFVCTANRTFSLPAGSEIIVSVRYTPDAVGNDSAAAAFSGGGGYTAPLFANGGTFSGGLTLEVNSAAVSGSFAVSEGLISQTDTTEISDGGRAVWDFSVPTSGEYGIRADVLAPTESSNSLFVNIDAEPADPGNIWDIATSSVVTNALITWRGAGAPVPHANPQFWTLNAGNHQLVVRGREGGTRFGRMTVIRRPSTPVNFDVRR